ncbi:MAG TPA: transposase, partial [Algoriphagus sp.]|nr:transposase [Algoriphagus sp.]
ISQRLRQEGFDPDTLEWESDYHAHSVSLNRLSVEKSLIERQDIKHKEISLKEELKFLGL